MGISDWTILGRRNSWWTGAVAGFSFILNKLNLLASLNLLERICLHKAVGERSRGRRWTDATLSQLGPTFGLTGTDRISNLVRRADRHCRQLSSWRKPRQEIEASLDLYTEHKARFRRSPKLGVSREERFSGSWLVRCPANFSRIPVESM